MWILPGMNAEGMQICNGELVCTWVWDEEPMFLIKSELLKK